MGFANRAATLYMKLRHTPQPFKVGWPLLAPVDTSVPILGIFPEPQPCKGIDLLENLMAVSKPHARNQYKMMSLEDQAKLQDENGTYHEHRHRIWRGYEIVEWRKRNDGNPDGNDFNPFVNTGLAPWEIVKNKLRNGRKLALSLDCYDAFIRQALHSTLPRTAFDIYYTDHRLNIDGTPRQTIEKMYTKISQQERRRIESLVNRNNEHIFWANKLRATRSEFHQFYKENVDCSHQRPLLNVLRKWDASPMDIPSRDPVPYNRVAAHEMKLDMQTAMVLDYMYYAGTVEGAPLEYSWAQDMRERVGGWVYLPGGYCNLSLYSPLLSEKKRRCKTEGGVST